MANKNDSLFRKKGRFEGVNLGDVFFCQFSKAKSYVVAIGLEIRTAAKCDGKKLAKILKDLLKFPNIIDSNTYIDDDIDGLIDYVLNKDRKVKHKN